MAGRSKASKRKANTALTASDMVDNRIMQKTRKQYNAFLQKFVKFYADKAKKDATPTGSVLEENDEVFQQKVEDFFSTYQYLDYEGSGADLDPGEDGATIGNRKLRSKSGMELAASAIKHHFTDQQKDVPTGLNQFLTTYLEGYTRILKGMEQTGERSPEAGRAPFSQINFHLLCEVAVHKEKVLLKDNRNGTKSVVGNIVYNILSMVLCWNLIARSISVLQLHYTHLYWVSILTYFILDII